MRLELFLPQLRHLPHNSTTPRLSSATVPRSPKRTARTQYTDKYSICRITQ